MSKSDNSIDYHTSVATNKDFNRVNYHKLMLPVTFIIKDDFKS